MRPICRIVGTDISHVLTRISNMHHWPHLTKTQFGGYSLGYLTTGVDRYVIKNILVKYFLSSHFKLFQK